MNSKFLRALANRQNEEGVVVADIDTWENNFRIASAGRHGLGRRWSVTAPLVIKPSLAWTGSTCIGAARRRGADVPWCSRCSASACG